MASMSNTTDILFINPFPSKAVGINQATVIPPLGAGYIAALLEREGFNCKIIDANVQKIDNKELLQEINRISPSFVGLTLNIITSPPGIEISQMLKLERQDIYVIVGGPNPTASPENTLQRSNADLIVLGEGELTTLEIMRTWRNNGKVKKFPLHHIKGIMFRDQEKEEFVYTPPRERIKDLDSIPPPAYHLFPDLMLYKSRARTPPVGYLLTTRGCPYQCIYCNKSVFGNKVTMLSPRRVLEDIDFLVKKYHIRQIDILDDLFTINKNRTNEILDSLIERNYKLDINFQNGIRIEKMDKDIIKKMKRAGVFKIGIGVESGDPQVLKNIKKKLNLDKVLEVTRWFKNEGILVYGFFIFGLPGDTVQTMQRTIDFAKKMDPDVANFGIAIPFVGTELYNIIKKRGKFLINPEGDIFGGFHSKQVFYELDDLKKELVVKYFDKAYRQFYFRPQKALKLLFGARSLAELKWILEAVFSIITVKLTKIIHPLKKLFL